MIDNLHSLINKPWYINKEYAQGLFPVFLNLIQGNTEVTERDPEQITQFFDADGQPVESEPITKKEDEVARLPVLVVGAGSSGSSGAPDPVTAVISIKTPIYKYDQVCGPRGTKSMMRQMEALRNRSDINGIILDIDSGGGQLSGTQEFYDYIKDYSKPVVTYSDGWICSAAYYIGSAADHIIAHQRADAIGSIGAYIEFVDLKGYYEQMGAKVHTIYSSLSDEKNQAYREALEGSYDLMIKEELDPAVQDFHADMKLVREDLNDQVFKGATYPAAKSLELGLIDEIGNFQAALDKVKELAQNSKSDYMNTSKDRPNLQGVLNLNEPLAVTEDQGSYLNEEQLDLVEDALNMSQVETAEDLQQELNQAEQEASAMATTIQNLANEFEIEQGETPAETLANVQAHITELNKTPAEQHTTAADTDEDGSKYPYIDFSADHYQN